MVCIWPVGTYFSPLLLFLKLLKGHFNDLGVLKPHSISNTHNIFWNLLSKTAVCLSLSVSFSL